RALSGLAVAAGAEGRWERALRLAGAAETVVAATGPSVGTALPAPVMLRMIEAEVAEVHVQGRAALGEPAGAPPWSRGRARTLERAVAYALDDAGEPARA